MSMLEIKDLHARAPEQEILKGVDLTVEAGQVHAVMGPNGSGKSTLARVLAGDAVYEVTGGQVLYRGQDLLDMEPEVRAREGLFLAFQYPVEIPGVSTRGLLAPSCHRSMRSRPPSSSRSHWVAKVRDPKAGPLAPCRTAAPRRSTVSSGWRPGREVSRCCVGCSRVIRADSSAKATSPRCARSMSDSIRPWWMRASRPRSEWWTKC